MSVADLCRKHGVSDASIYKWKTKFGGMEVFEAKLLRALEDENAKPKRMLADAGWTRCVEGSHGKEIATPTAEQKAIARLVVDHGMTDSCGK